MARKTKAPPCPYAVHPSVAMVQNWVESLKDRTGRSLEQWVALVKKAGPPDEKGRRDWLKKEHGFNSNFAWWMAERASGTGWVDADPEAYLSQAVQWVDAMFSGPKAGLRPVYEELLRLGKSLGPDVRVCPCQTIVPFYRQHVFAQVKPATRTRIDLGLALQDTPCSGRLIDTGGRAKGDRLTHRIAVTSAAEIDGEVRHWLKAAYELAAPK